MTTRKYRIGEIKKKKFKKINFGNSVHFETSPLILVALFSLYNNILAQIVYKYLGCLLQFKQNEQFSLLTIM